MRILYRTAQFWQAVLARPAPEELELAQSVLSPALMALFLRLQASEQVHSLRIFHRLREQGEKNQELLAAALLHDIGKTRHPLRIWERVLVVMGKALFSSQVKCWGQGPPYGWRRAFVIAEQHPAWGAELAMQAGASPLTVALILRHQNTRPGKKKNVPQEHLPFEDQLLHRLQRLDDES